MFWNNGTTVVQAFGWNWISVFRFWKGIVCKFDISYRKWQMWGEQSAAAAFSHIRYSEMCEYVRERERERLLFPSSVGSGYFNQSKMWLKTLRQIWLVVPQTLSSLICPVFCPLSSLFLASFQRFSLDGALGELEPEQIFWENQPQKFPTSRSRRKIPGKAVLWMDLCMTSVNFSLQLSFNSVLMSWIHFHHLRDESRRWWKSVLSCSEYQ